MVRRHGRGDVRIEHPNRKKASSKASKAVVILLLLLSAALVLIITIGGWDALTGAKLRSSRLHPHLPRDRVLHRQLAPRPVAGRRGARDHPAHLRRGSQGKEWFGRDKEGSTDPPLDESILGLLTLLIIPIQVLVITFAGRRPSRRSGASRSSGARTARPTPAPAAG